MKTFSFGVTRTCSNTATNIDDLKHQRQTLNTKLFSELRSVHWNGEQSPWSVFLRLKIEVECFSFGDTFQFYFGQKGVVSWEDTSYITLKLPKKNSIRLSCICVSVKDAVQFFCLLKRFRLGFISKCPRDRGVISISIELGSTHLCQRGVVVLDFKCLVMRHSITLSFTSTWMDHFNTLDAWITECRITMVSLLQLVNLLQRFISLARRMLLASRGPKLRMANPRLTIKPWLKPETAHEKLWHPG